MLRNWPQRLAFCLATTTSTLPGAEPGVDPTELPRIPPTPPEQAVATFQVSPGFRMELVAAEPLVADPIALAFDEAGRLLVVEMRGYSERQTEHLGQIRLLEDRDADGIFDHSRVFADHLDWPTAVICWDGGVFVAATPDILFLKDTTGDGRADLRQTVFTGFARGVSRLNVQALPNNLTWGLDQRIHGATSFNGGSVAPAGQPDAQALPLRGRDFSFDPRLSDLRPESGGGQHGLTFDDQGRKFVCSNSRHIQQVMVEDLYASRGSYPSLPSPLADIAAEGPAAEVFRISADEPWRVVRTRWRVAGLVSGPVEGGGRVSGYFTAATGITVYRGHAWPPSHQGDVFIGDAGSNLIHRKKFSAQPRDLSLIAARAAEETGREFVASTDNWFRPVQLTNGPDGCLYVADMYREIIEHPWSLPPNIKQHLDLNSGNDRGRIYRVVPDGFAQPAPPRLHQASTGELVDTLSHANGWHRDTASRLLCEQRRPEAAALLRETLRSAASGHARLHSLHVLNNLGHLDLRNLNQALDDRHPPVRAHAVRLAHATLNTQSSFTGSFWNNLLSKTADPDPEVRYQLALALGEFADPQLIPALTELARHDHADPWIGRAILSSLGAARVPGKPSPAFQAWSALVNDPALTGTDSGRAWLGQLTAMIGHIADSSATTQTLERIAQLEDFPLASLLVQRLNQGSRQSGSPLDPSIAPVAWGTLSKTALTILRDRSQPENSRLAGLQLLRLAPSAAGGEILARLWIQEKPGPLQEAALSAFLEAPGAQPARDVLARWPDLPTPSRRLALEAMIKDPARVTDLLAALETKTVSPNDLTSSQTDSLRHHADKNLRVKAVQLLGAAPVPEGPGKLEDHAQALQLAGRADRGKTHFQERCAPCHLVAGEGNDLGPDLATVRNAGQEKILLSILDPNREVAPNFVAYEIETQDNESLSGIIARETTTAITLRQANGIETQLNRRQVKSMRSRGQSLMPEGLVRDLNDQDLADLLAYLLQEQ